MLIYMGLFQKTTSDIGFEKSIVERTPCKGGGGLEVIKIQMYKERTKL